MTARGKLVRWIEGSDTDQYARRQRNIAKNFLLIYGHEPDAAELAAHMAGTYQPPEPTNRRTSK